MKSFWQFVEIKQIQLKSKCYKEQRFFKPLEKVLNNKRVVWELLVPHRTSGYCSILFYMLISLIFLHDIYPAGNCSALGAPERSPSWDS